MKINLVILFMIFNCMTMLGSTYIDNLQNDTIDYNGNRLFVRVPKLSIAFSTQFDSSEGFSIIYPFQSSSGILCGLCFDFMSMNDLMMYDDNEIDKELWNTLNKGHVGSRCYIKKGLYNRIDNYGNGLIIYYTNVAEDLVSLLNEVMKSIYIRVKLPSDPKLDVNKRRRQNIESCEPHNL